MDDHYKYLIRRKAIAKKKKKSIFISHLCCV